MKGFFVGIGLGALLASGIFVLLYSLGLLPAPESHRQSDIRVVEFHSEGEPDGFCYVTAQHGKTLLYARSIRGEQWTCNFLEVGNNVKRLLRKGYSNEELEAHVDMSHEPLAPNGKVPPDFDMHFFIYGGRERDYSPVDLGTKAPVGVPKCSIVPAAEKWNTPCRDESGILVNPLADPNSP